MPADTEPPSMRLMLDEAHFAGAEKVLARTSRPRLRHVVTSLSGGLAARHVGSRSHFYSERRTSVALAGFEVYRDAHFYYEAQYGVFSVGVFLGPSDDVARPGNPAPFDSDLVRDRLSPGWPGVGTFPRPHDGQWVMLPEESPDSLRARWATVERWAIEYRLGRAALLALPEYQRGEVIALVMQTLVPLILDLRSGHGTQP